MQRKIKHFMSLIKGIALLNAPFRMNDDGKIVATNKDVDEAVKLWEAVSESMFYGLPPQVIDFYKNYVLPAYLEINEGVEESRRQPVTTNQICMFYYNSYAKLAQSRHDYQNVHPNSRGGSIY